jgi:hypothetical protein
MSTRPDVPLASIAYLENMSLSRNWRGLPVPLAKWVNVDLGHVMHTEQ